MQLTILGGGGAWPLPDVPCSGYLLETGGFSLLIDPGYGSTARLLAHCRAHDVDAVFVSHRHPDHCADLNPLLRARILDDEPAEPLPVFAPRDAVQGVIALDKAELTDGHYRLHEFALGDTFEIGPFRAQTRELPHSVPNAGVRLSATGRSLTYTGDCGPSPALPELAEGSDVLLAEASVLDVVPEDMRGLLSSAGDVGREARLAGVGRLVLTHLMPGADPRAWLRAAREEYDGPSLVARPDRVVEMR